MTATYHLKITGRVQGVGFRMYLRQEAERLGVCGWVRNRRDGSVEAMVQGAQDAVDALIERARHGPRDARVTGVGVSAGDGSYSGFEMRATE
jgi:acylphosphatase